MVAAAPCSTAATSTRTGLIAEMRWAGGANRRPLSLWLNEAREDAAERKATRGF